MIGQSRGLGCVAVLGLLMSISLAARAVDGVTLIDQSKAFAGGITPADAPGFPVTISRSGSYRLQGNLNPPAGTPVAVEITAESVTLDLNGFAIDYLLTIQTDTRTVVKGEAGGIGIKAFVDDVTILNGSVRNTATGLLLGGNRATVERVHVLDSLFRAVELGQFGRLDSSVVANGKGGILCAGHCIIRGNFVSNVEGAIFTDAGVIQGNVVVNNVSGITANFGTILDNEIQSNKGSHGGIACTNGCSCSNNVLRGNGAPQVTGCLSGNVCIPVGGGGDSRCD